uniref:Uncharacterized protein n=1 Tax=viral metagenome TaxID=1070528 RepID=A0A6C0F5H4_9ZZZZ|tara:strand:- start:17485 stop:17880 length:396 start_codon:yes stop_codon:yes gene_type:complete
MERYFVVTNVRKSAQKKKGVKESTKFDKTATYKGTHERAARKAFSSLCNTKKISGRCALNITVKEVDRKKDPVTYADGRIKEKTYSLRRQKLKTPIEIERGGKLVTYEWKTVSRKTRNVCTKKSKLRRCKK